MSRVISVYRLGWSEMSGLTHDGDEHRLYAPFLYSSIVFRVAGVVG